MKGYWLKRVDGIFATNKKPWAFDRLSMTLERRGKNCHVRQYFIPQQMCTDQYRQNNIPVEEQIGNSVIEQLASNVDFNQGDEDSLSKQLKQARLEKIKTDTKLINQKLDQRKKLLFAEWSQKFYDQFSNHFGRLRNCLVNMHLNEQQIAKFNQTLDNCLNNLQLSLDTIWNDFTSQEKADEGKEGLEV